MHAADVNYLCHKGPNYAHILFIYIKEADALNYQALLVVLSRLFFLPGFKGVFILEELNRLI